MFQKKVDEMGTVGYASYGHALAGSSVDNYPISGFNDYFQKRNGTSDQYDVVKPTSLTTNAVFMNPAYPDLAFSIAIGFPIGFDLTAKVSNSLYATGSFGWTEFAPMNGQFILQRRLLDGNPTGLAIGVILVRTYVGYVVTGSDGEGCYLCITPNNYIGTTSVGIRAILTLKNTPQFYTRRRVFLYSNAAILYDMTMNLFYPKMGFSVGFY